MMIHHGMRDRADQALHRLRLDHLLRRQVADVEQDRSQEDEHSAVETELAAALDHLRHAEAGALDRVQRGEGHAQQRADDQGD